MHRKIFALLVGALIFVSFNQKAQAQAETKQPTAVLNHLAIYVADLQTATDFYQSLFNLPQIPNPFNDGKHTWLALSATAQLHIIKGVKMKGTYDINEHLCFSVPSVAIFVEKLKVKNIIYGNFSKVAGAVTLRPDGVKQIYFQDPDGHWLEVNDAKQAQ